MFLATICLLTLLELCNQEEIEAGTFDNAYTFYQTYGSEMKFQSGSDRSGEIYYATRGKKAATSGTQYTTIGWQVTIKNSSGTVMDTLYYTLGGSNMVTVDTQLISGYEYTLYKVTLSNMKSRMSSAALNALNTANCSIIFDACTTTKLNGVIQGGMTDSGPSWGKVYTTYNGIASAQNWSSATKQTLRTYYDKTIDGMFYTVNLDKGSGIASVSGSGKYCFGTTVTISATPESGYKFSQWTGNTTSTSQTLSFVIYDSDVSYTATAKREDLTVYFYKGTETGNTASATKKYEHEKTGQTLPNFGWTKEGYHQIGWSKTKNGTNASYAITSPVSQNWINQNMPSVNLYAVWSINSYTVTFQGNGGEGNIESQRANFDAKITLPNQGFYKEGSCICGWSTKPDSKEPEYPFGEEFYIKDIVKSLGLENTHNGTVILYAVWDNAPVIECENIYVSLEDAKAGVITGERLAEFVQAHDEEDGDINYGVNENNSLIIENYDTTDFTVFEKEGSVTETFVATDSSGNITRKVVWVHIVDTTIYDANLLMGDIRFISSSHYKDNSGNYILASEGGLPEDSIWRLDNSHIELLNRLLEL